MSSEKDFEDQTTETDSTDEITILRGNSLSGKISAVARKKVFQAGAVAAFALGLLLSGWFLFQTNVKPAEDIKISRAEKPFTQYSFSPFFLPVSTRDGKERMLRIRFAVQLVPGPDEEIRNNLSLLRSILYDRLRSRSAEDLAGWEGRLAFKREIQGILNKSLKDCKVEKVLVTELLVF